jgi:hypothetical protein
MEATMMRDHRPLSCEEEPHESSVETRETVTEEFLGQEERGSESGVRVTERGRDEEEAHTDVLAHEDQAPDIGGVELDFLQDQQEQPPTVVEERTRSLDSSETSEPIEPVPGGAGFLPVQENGFGLDGENERLVKHGRNTTGMPLSFHSAGDFRTRMITGLEDYFSHLSNDPRARSGVIRRVLEQIRPFEPHWTAASLHQWFYSMREQYTYIGDVPSVRPETLPEPVTLPLPPPA